MRKVLIYYVILLNQLCVANASTKRNIRLVGEQQNKANIGSTNERRVNVALAPQIAVLNDILNSIPIDSTSPSLRPPLTSSPSSSPSEGRYFLNDILNAIPIDSTSP
eukprot:CAMPEP_0178927882 /NCGR_PEP_ID=MMETSP0786-20121207/19498_1 /TAXON_ID=186022 /ORGANISM="Thalassionema frauenfeldii, Strain CCMP 1798" /LENGTH=106 /DNA_ID=CAMNT_0020603491 /DNA_START=144 /DNA_END=461 /DNA_ORIENTATION=-